MTLASATPLFSFLNGTTVTLRDAVTATADVVIVFYIIFRALKLVRGTRAAQTMTGMALIIGFFFFAKRLDLITVSWLFEKLIDYFIIFFVVIFQQDIRRALMQVGQNLFMRRQYEETYVIEEVVQAAGELAKQSTGALIVIERDADLSDHLGEVGVELDAKVTKELLITLFIPEAANHMHDGAVIIRNLRIHQAGAVLPLSANTKLDKQLGTRHRAAIGVTEETDAVVVVVSEERGTVSLCFNGNIARDLDAATLRKALLGLFQKKKNKGKGQPAGRGARTETKSGDITLGGLKLGGPANAPVPVAVPAEPPPARVPPSMPPELLALMQTQPFMLPVDVGMLSAGAVPRPIEHSEPTIRLSAAQLAMTAQTHSTAAETQRVNTIGMASLPAALPVAIDAQKTRPVAIANLSAASASDTQQTNPVDPVSDSGSSGEPVLPTVPMPAERKPAAPQADDSGTSGEAVRTTAPLAAERKPAAAKAE